MSSTKCVSYIHLYALCNYSKYIAAPGGLLLSHYNMQSLVCPIPSCNARVLCAKDYFVDPNSNNLFSAIGTN